MTWSVLGRDSPQLLGSPRPSRGEVLDLPRLHGTLVWLNSLSWVSVGGVQPGGFLVWGGQAATLHWPGPSQGPHCCSQQLGEISAAVGCQFSAGTDVEGRVGWREEECLNWAGFREVICT